MKMKTIMTILAVLAIVGPATAAEKLELNQLKSKVGFEIVKFKIGGTVSGQFDAFYGVGQFDADAKSVEGLKATVYAPSVNTKDQKRDRHLRTEDFFGVLKDPLIHFESTEKVKVGGKFKLKGNLTIRGIKKPIILDMETKEFAKKSIRLVGSTKINRLDFGVSWNHAMEKGDWKKVLGVLGKMVLDDTVTLKLDLVADRVK
jgi:polyisoprenoid-binding protein YceI